MSSSVLQSIKLNRSKIHYLIKKLLKLPLKTPCWSPQMCWNAKELWILHSCVWISQPNWNFNCKVVITIEINKPQCMNGSKSNQGSFFLKRFAICLMKGLVAPVFGSERVKKLILKTCAYFVFGEMNDWLMTVQQLTPSQSNGLTLRHLTQSSHFHPPHRLVNLTHQNKQSTSISSQ